MSTVLAAIDGGARSASVLAAAQALAAGIGAVPAAFHVDEGDAAAADEVARSAGVPLRVEAGAPVERIVHAASSEDIRAVAVGVRGGLRRPPDDGHVALEVVLGSDRAVLAVPEGAHVPGDGRFHRVLVPLEGTMETSQAVTATVRDLAAGGAGIVVAHVRAPASTPPYRDQAGHADQAWASEFLCRWCDEPGAEAHVRAGDAPEALVDVARSASVDLIVLGWGRHADEGRAQVVRALLAEATVPVLLVPISAVPAGRRAPAAR